MNATLRKATSILLSILMTLSLLTVGITTAVAETAPTIDGVKDDIYTDSKRVIIPYAYGGAGQPEIENTYGVYSTSYFTWDDTSVYLYIETYDPNHVAQMDLVYLVSDISTHMTGYVHENASGAYMQYTPSSSDLQTGGKLALDCKTNVTETGRSYEIKFDRVGTTGFSFTPVIYLCSGFLRKGGE